MDYYGNPIELQASRIEYKYEGRILTEKWNVAEDSLIYEHYAFKYDSTGEKIEQRQLDKIDEIDKNLFTWKYDKAGKLIEENRFFNGGKNFIRLEFLYNENGDLVEQVEYSDYDNVRIKITYKYGVMDEKKKNVR